MSIFEYNGSALVAMVGKNCFAIASDRRLGWLVFRHKLYQLREERDMRPETFASLVSAMLYEKRFGPYFCQPVIAGLGEDDKPFICTMDSIGAKYVYFFMLLLLLILV
ncbi:putative proteasome endopeptidase complex [Helianthus annuus]|nr:putative proteasome endopeptidase complex [Helianthus annuus]KAJ0813331.1 putative proteasome endopeptidase complex [Helianthus annuus]